MNPQRRFPWKRPSIVSNDIHAGLLHPGRGAAKPTATGTEKDRTSDWGSVAHALQGTAGICQQVRWGPRLLLGAGLDPLKFLDEFLSNQFVVNDEDILVIFILGPACEIV